MSQQRTENNWLPTLVNDPVPIVTSVLKGETETQRFVGSYLNGELEGQRLIAEEQERKRESQQPRPLFKEINALRQAQLAPTPEDVEAAEKLKFNDTIFGQIAVSKAFEFLTLGLISLNAVAIGYDADYDARWGKAANLYDGPTQFIITEWVFAIYFTAEIVIRFLGYKNKVDCLCDAWFMFDSVLVTIMIAETWVLPLVSSGGPLGMLSVLRLLRLLRITRMARLMRAVPEMMILCKGMIAATRTVVCTGALLLLVLYTFSILFTSEFHQGDTTDDDVSDEQPWESFFGSMGKSMFTLFIMGTILDDYTAASDAIRASGNTGMLIAFIIFTLISSFMMLNMLIGVLVEVVDATKEGERNKAIETKVRDAIGQLFDNIDQDCNKEISRGEFMAMRKHPEVMEALKELDIGGMHFDVYAELFFTPPEEGMPPPTLGYEALITMIMRLRPGSFVSALDFATFARSISCIHDRIKERMVRVESLCREIAGEVLDRTETPGYGLVSHESSGGDLLVVTGSENTSEGQGPRGKILDGPAALQNLLGSPEGRTLDRPAALQDCVAVVEGNSSRLLSDADEERLDRTEISEIIEELQRRLGMADLEKTGVPYSMLDEELQDRLKAVTERDIAEFTIPGVPLSESDTGIVYV